MKSILPNFIVRIIKTLKHDIIKLNESDFVPPKISAELKRQLDDMFRKKINILVILQGRISLVGLNDLAQQHFINSNISDLNKI